MPVITVSPAPRDNNIRCGNHIESETKDQDIHHENNQDFDKEDELLYRSLRPMLITMKVFGLYFLDKTSFTKTLHCKALCGYSIVVMMLLWGNILMNIPGVGSYKTLDEAIVNGTTYTWNFYCCCNASDLFLMCIRENGWKYFFTLKGLTESFKADGCIFFKRRICIYVTITWIAVIINVGFQVYGIFSAETLNFYIFTMGKDNLEVIVLKCVQSVASVYRTVAWTISTMLTVLISDILSTNYQCFNRNLSEGLGKRPFSLCRTLVSCRDEHQRLTDITLAADALLSDTIGITIIFDVMSFCGTMYGVIHNLYDFRNTLVTMTIIFWLAVTLIHLFVTIGTCNWVNDQVRN